MNITKHEKRVKELFVQRCWEYLHDNFHKFNEANKIKIALAICTKNMPTQLEPVSERQMKVVIIRDEKEEIKQQMQQPLPFKILEVEKLLR